MRNSIKKLMVGALAFVTTASAASAAPLFTVTVLGRLSGSGDAFSNTVVLPDANVPKSIDYQLVFDMAPVGTQNVQGALTRTITSLTPGTDGINASKHDLIQLSSASGIQVNFATPMSLDAAWDDVTGASAGTPTLRTATDNNLLGIRMGHGAGVFTAIDPEVVGTGILQATALGDFSAAVVTARFASVTPSASARINTSTTLIINATTEGGADPFIGYNPLTILIPEPGTVGLAALSLLGLAARRRRIA